MVVLIGILRQFPLVARSYVKGGLLIGSIEIAGLGTCIQLLHGMSQHHGGVYHQLIDA